MKFKTLKKAGILFFIAIGCMLSVKAQVSATANTTLQVKLNPLINIQVNQATVLLQFTTLADYQNGVTNSLVGHLTVSSLLPYTLNLKANNPTLAGTTGNTATIDPSVVNVALPNGGTLGGTYTPITGLTPTAKNLIVAGTPVLAKNIDVTYSTAANSVGIIGKPADTYSSTITYTISSL